MPATDLGKRVARRKLWTPEKTQDGSGHSDGSSWRDVGSEPTTPAQSDMGTGPELDSAAKHAADVLVGLRGLEEEGHSYGPKKGHSSKKVCCCDNPSCIGPLMNGHDCGLELCGGFDGKCICDAEHRIPEPKKTGDVRMDWLRVLRRRASQKELDAFLLKSKVLRVSTHHFSNSEKHWARAGGKAAGQGGKTHRVMVNSGAMPRYDLYVEENGLLAQVRCVSRVCARTHKWTSAISLIVCAHAHCVYRLGLPEQVLPCLAWTCSASPHLV